MNDSRHQFDLLSVSGGVKLLRNCCKVAHIFPPYVATLPRPVLRIVLSDINGGKRNISYTHCRSTIRTKSQSVSIYLLRCTVKFCERRSLPISGPYLGLRGVTGLTPPEMFRRKCQEKLSGVYKMQETARADPAGRAY